MADVKIAPSILAADFTRLGEQIRAIDEGGADYVHIDVMDGRFVPNITMGPLIVEAVRRSTDLPLDVHLMIVEPDRHIDAMVGAGASLLTFHPESTPHTHRVAYSIRKLGAKAGIVLNPGTPIAAVEELLPDIDVVLVMSVNPGWGGQPLIHNTLEKLSRLRDIVRERRLPIELEIDGGIKEDTAPAAVTAGAVILVSGTGVYNDRESPAAAIARLRRAVADL